MVFETVDLPRLRESGWSVAFFIGGGKANQSPEIFTTKCGDEILTLQGAVSVLKDGALSYDSYTPYRIFYHSHPTAERTLECLDYLPEEEGKKLA